VLGYIIAKSIELDELDDAFINTCRSECEYESVIDDD
jgi:hypothetical protein